MLLVGSVFADDSPRQVALLELQLKFLKATTPDFRHVAYLASAPRTDDFTSRTDVIVGQPDLEIGEAHLAGLQTLLDEFRDRKKDYNDFLILDSDAFPIKAGWMAQLISKMETPIFDSGGNYMFNRNDPYEIAAALRYENMERRLHASILFMRKKALNHIEFQSGYVGMDLVGNREIDIHIAPYQSDKREYAFPLIRSNAFNVHPLACGIYFDSFYHHGAGSRDLVVRGRNYWDKYCPADKDYMDDLMADPSGFVAKLAGWNSERYARV